MDEALAQPAPDGCVARLAEGRAEVVAEGIYFSNGVALDRDEAFLYVAATLERSVLRYRIGPDGSLTGREDLRAGAPGRPGLPGRHRL